MVDTMIQVVLAMDSATNMQESNLHQIFEFLTKESNVATSEICILQGVPSTAAFG